MRRTFTGILTAGLVIAAVGCHEDRPHDYGEQRPPVDQLDPRDSGLQSKDVVAASDKMAMDILGSIPELNESPRLSEDQGLAGAPGANSGAGR